MKSFDYKIKDEIGIHARPAGLLAKTAKEFSSTVTVEKNGRSAVVTRLLSLMGLGVKCGDTVTVKVEGEDEEMAFEKIKSFFESTL